MNYEKKYNYVLKRAKALKEYSLSPQIKDWVDSVFPELKESEDERIRKEIISALKYANHEGVYNKHLAWLEKQGKNNSCKFTFEDVLALECSMKTAKTIKGGDELYKILVPLYNKIHDAYLIEKQGDKLADTVEPKFNAGDWIVFNGLVLFIKEVVQGYYRTISVGGIPNSYDWDIDNVARLWTIKDAKDGDVLYSSDSNQPFIYKCRNDGEQATCYCGINKFGKFFIWNTKDCIITLDKYVPTTKEQRDLLFSKMKEAGYEWDNEKKELNMFEKQDQVKETTITCRDEKIRKALINFFNDSYCHDGQIVENCEVTVNDVLIWLEKQGREKPKWTLRDDELYQDALDVFETLGNDFNPLEDYHKLYDWLKIIKQKIEEQH